MMSNSDESIVVRNKLRLALLKQAQSSDTSQSLIKKLEGNKLSIGLLIPYSPTLALSQHGADVVKAMIRHSQGNQLMWIGEALVASWPLFEAVIQCSHGIHVILELMKPGISSDTGRRKALAKEILNITLPEYWHKHSDSLAILDACFPLADELVQSRLLRASNFLSEIFKTPALPGANSPMLKYLGDKKPHIADAVRHWLKNRFEADVSFVTDMTTIVLNADDYLARFVLRWMLWFNGLFGLRGFMLQTVKHNSVSEDRRAMITRVVMSGLLERNTMLCEILDDAETVDFIVKTVDLTVRAQLATAVEKRTLWKHWTPEFARNLCARLVPSYYRSLPPAPPPAAAYTEQDIDALLEELEARGSMEPEDSSRDNNQYERTENTVASPTIRSNSSPSPPSDAIPSTSVAIHNSAELASQDDELVVKKRRVDVKKKVDAEEPSEVVVDTSSSKMVEVKQEIVEDEDEIQIIDVPKKLSALRNPSCRPGPSRPRQQRSKTTSPPPLSEEQAKQQRDFMEKLNNAISSTDVVFKYFASALLSGRVPAPGEAVARISESAETLCRRSEGGLNLVVLVAEKWPESRLQILLQVTSLVGWLCGRNSGRRLVKLLLDQKTRASFANLFFNDDATPPFITLLNEDQDLSDDVFDSAERSVKEAFIKTRKDEILRTRHGVEFFRVLVASGQFPDLEVDLSVNRSKESAEVVPCPSSNPPRRLW